MCLCMLVNFPSASYGKRILSYCFKSKKGGKVVLSLQKNYLQYFREYECTSFPFL